MTEMKSKLRVSDMEIYVIRDALVRYYDACQKKAVSELRTAAVLYGQGELTQEQEEDLTRMRGYLTDAKRDYQIIKALTSSDDFNEELRLLVNKHLEKIN